MSLNLEQTEGTEGTDGTPPQPCKPKDASSATAAADPSFSSSRRVTLCINPRLLMRSPAERSVRPRGFEGDDRLPDHSSAASAKCVCTIAAKGRYRALFMGA